MKTYLLEVDKGIYYIFDPVVTKHAYTYTSIYSFLYHCKISYLKGRYYELNVCIRANS